ncbi:Asp-tRNA(Asn)/Glu-tRNA(Gln) amidotransferase subunit GatC, partial [Acetobacteraceae bacterium]|nr:Asp-tRNA(Asn)/Glu-tRNA(Gln) amidotransferase subunit GatC [Candidatus Parcubacteria bacterium]
MISKEEIQNLSQLARLELKEEEITSLQKDLSDILNYVGQIKSSEKAADSAPASRNVLRRDEPHAQESLLAGKREAILEAFPKRENDYLLVRKIISKDE